MKIPYCRRLHTVCTCGPSLDIDTPSLNYELRDVVRDQSPNSVVSPLFNRFREVPYSQVEESLLLTFGPRNPIISVTAVYGNDVLEVCVQVKRIPKVWVNPNSLYFSGKRLEKWTHQDIGVGGILTHELTVRMPQKHVFFSDFARVRADVVRMVEAYATQEQ